MAVINTIQLFNNFLHGQLFGLLNKHRKKYITAVICKVLKRCNLYSYYDNELQTYNRSCSLVGAGVGLTPMRSINYFLFLKLNL
jgi:hypothetical protein